MEGHAIERPVGSFVADNFKAAGVFQKYGIDFCCGGKQRLYDACEERGIDSETVMQELAALNADQTGVTAANTMDLDILTEYIVATHHVYINNSTPNITAFANKVAEVHGVRHPETVEIRDLFAELSGELDRHMFKEERVLFPYIAALAGAKRNGGGAQPSHFGTVANPISMMEAEHESAGGLMSRINQLSAGYNPPEDACTTYRVLFQELAAFEKDLHTHIHLENNILHPKAVKLEREIG